MSCPPPNTAAALRDLPVPPITRRAAAYVTTTDHVAAVVAAYHRPFVRHPHPHAPALEQRRAGRCLLTVVRATGLVCSVRWVDHDNVPTPAPAARPAPRRGSRGGRGNVWPTTWPDLHKRLKAHGCAIEMGGKHWHVTLPDGSTYTMSCTASDWRSLRNAASQLRARGVDVRSAGT